MLCVLKPAVADRARRYEQAGIKPLDAVHLASAVAVDADFFCTVDDGLLRKAQTANTGATHVVSSHELMMELALNIPERPLAEVTERAIDALVRELGVADTARFLHQFGVGYGDYTAEREALFGHLSLDEIIEQSRRYGRKKNT